MIGLLVGALAGAGVWLLMPHRAFEPAALIAAARCAGAGLAAALLALGLSGLPVVAGIAGVAAAGAVAGLPRRRRRRRRRERADAWPDAIDVIRGAIRAGVALPEAVAAAADSGPDPLRPVFDAYRRRLAAGQSFDLAVRVLADDPVGKRVATVLAGAMALGSPDVGRVLEALASFLRADTADRREIAARQSWNVAAARLAVAAPWITVLLMSTRPSARAAYGSAAGWILLTGVAVATSGAYWLMLRITGLHEATL